jgi:HK97 family phage major capsid protein
LRQQAEQRGTQLVGTDNVGGYTVPDEMMRPIDNALLQFGGMRQTSTIIATATGAALPIPTANDTTISGEIIAEDSAVNEQTVAFGQVTLNAYKYSSKMIPISVELLQDSATNMPAFLGARIGERIGRITNAHATTGDGSSKPYGIVTGASTSGITAATSGVYAFGEILSLIHSVDPAYRQNARFMFADATLLILKQMKDSQNRPIWMPSLVPGEPDTFGGYGYVINQSVATGSGAKAILFGDLSKYYIRDVLGITLLRLNERYAEYHRVAFLAFARFDGRLIDAGTKPVKYLTNAT